jgi:hypothetical protein
VVSSRAGSSPVVASRTGCGFRCVHPATLPQAPRSRHLRPTTTSRSRARLQAHTPPRAPLVRDDRLLSRCLGKVALRGRSWLIGGAHAAHAETQHALPALAEPAGIPVGPDQPPIPPFDLLEPAVGAPARGRGGALAVAFELPQERDRSTPMRASAGSPSAAPRITGGQPAARIGHLPLVRLAPSATTP